MAKIIGSTKGRKRVRLFNPKTGSAFKSSPARSVTGKTIYKASAQQPGSHLTPVTGYQGLHISYIDVRNDYAVLVDKHGKRVSTVPVSVPEPDDSEIEYIMHLLRDGRAIMENANARLSAASEKAREVSNVYQEESRT